MNNEFSEAIKAEPVDSPPPDLSPLSLNAKSDQLGQSERGSMNGKVWHVAATTGFALLLALAFGVFYYLPQHVQDPRLPSPKEPHPEELVLSGGPAHRSTQTQGQEPWEQAQFTRAKQRADDMMLSLLEKQGQLQKLNVRRWAERAFDNAVAEAGKGDDLFAQGRLQEALDSYARADSKLDKLIADSDTLLHDALSRGRRDLAARDSEQAIAAFELALLIDPDHKEATKGIMRARRLPEVKALFESAAQHEQRGNLTQSRLEYSKAAELDPEFEAAHTALLRIDEKIKEFQFKVYMTQGLSALDRGDFDAAQEAFENARFLDPSSQAPIEGLSRLDSQRHLKQIDEHRRSAATLEAQERWKAAEGHYQAALKLDPTLVFAKRGENRSARRASLSEALQFHIQHPERLAAENVLVEAVKLRDRALAIETPGPVLKRQITKLSDSIERMTTPVRVRLQSDNKTRVALYKVGRLGSFEFKDLTLRPGNYTLVGTRDGYRDVRLQLTVVAGQPHPPVLVRCEERI